MTEEEEAGISERIPGQQRERERERETGKRRERCSKGNEFMRRGEMRIDMKTAEEKKSLRH